MKNKKVGIITIFDTENLGNRLQNYAVQELIKERGYDPYTVRVYDPHKVNMLKKSLMIRTRIVKNELLPIIVEKNKRKSLFIRFNRLYIKEAPFCIGTGYNEERAKRFFDYMVVGSDQVWNCQIGHGMDTEFLTFFPGEYSYSIAASFGMDTVPEAFKERYINGLMHLSKISVREKSGVNIVNQLCGKKAELIVDPTFVLKKEKWFNIEKKPSIDIPEEYEFRYFFNEDNSKKCSYNYPIIDALDNLWKEYIGPAEFLWLIHNASCVKTDSFHCVVFAIIYGKRVQVYNRVNGDSSMNDRIDTLLSFFYSPEKYRQDLQNGASFEVNIKDSDAVISIQRQRFEDFLSSAIGN